MNKLLFLFIVFAFSSKAQQTDTFRVVKQGEERAKKFESAFVTLGGKTGGDITVPEAQTSCCLIINRSDLRITSYTLTIKGTGDLMSYTAIGNSLTNEMIVALGKLKPGAIFVAENIMARGDDGIPRMVSSLYFKIK